MTDVRSILWILSKLSNIQPIDIHMFISSSSHLNSINFPNYLWFLCCFFIVSPLLNVIDFTILLVNFLGMKSGKSVNKWVGIVSFGRWLNYWLITAVVITSVTIRWGVLRTGHQINEISIPIHMMFTNVYTWSEWCNYQPYLFHPFHNALVSIYLFSIWV